MDKDTLFQEYNDKLPNYDRARENIKEALEEFLKEKNISFVTIESRIKDFESFLNSAGIICKLKEKKSKIFFNT